MNKLAHLLKNYWPIVTYGLLVLILFLVNYRTSTFLTSWDTLHPEFNPILNIKRSIFAVWQEYQGLGLLGGMGHASDLVRQIFLVALSFIFPISMIRYVWIFLTLFIGGTGTYFLTRFISKANSQNNNKLIPFLAGIFYIFNLSTVQTYYVAFEAFMAHFAALPWLILGSFIFYKKPSLKNLSIFTLILLLSTPSAYIPTLYVVFLASIAILLGTLTLLKKGTFMKLRFTAKGEQPLLKNLAKTYVVIFIVNAFWLLPFAYFTLTTSSVNLNSKINLMATPSIYARNREFGTPTKVFALEGFLLNTTEPDIKGKMNFVMPEWKGHLNSTPVNIAIIISVALILLGIISQLRSKNPYTKAFIVLFVFAFTLLATETLPFSFINDVLRSAFPILNQAFRFPFTKLSILASLTYAIFFAYGVGFLIEKLGRRNLIAISAILVIGVITTPLFRGQMFYSRARIEIPKRYFDLFQYLKYQDRMTRVANLPQASFWGWEYTDWGYAGSGFMWYALPQTVMDRAFDVWSSNNENYYYELSNAIYSKNADQFESILNKYQINWLIIDKSIVSPFSPKSLFIDETHGIISHINGVKKVRDFDNIELYKVNLIDKPKNFAFGTNLLPTINSYKWNNFDQAHLIFGNYREGDENEAPNGLWFDFFHHPEFVEGRPWYLLPLYNNNQAQNPSEAPLGGAKGDNYTFPFRSLLSTRTQADHEFETRETEKSIVITNKIAVEKDETIKIPKYIDSQKYVPTQISLVKSSGGLVVNLKVASPEVFVDGKKIYGGNLNLDLFVLPQDSSFPLTLDVNGVKKYKITNEEKYLGTTSLSTESENIITLSDSRGQSLNQVIDRQLLSSLPIFESKTVGISESKNVSISGPKGKEVEIKVVVPKVNDGHLNHVATSFTGKDCDLTKTGTIKFEQTQKGADIYSQGATACAYSLAKNLLHENAYAVFVTSKNIEGNPFHFWILNEDEKYAPIDTNLKQSRDFSTSSFILPTMEKYGRGYSFQIENVSISNHPTQNVLKKISAYPIPYEFVNLITFVGGKPNHIQSKVDFTTDHPNESVYRIRNIIIHDRTPFTIVLSQSYDNGWTAYKVTGSKSRVKQALNLYLPFVFGTKIKEHYKVNNWENGWTIDPTKLAQDKHEPQIIIVYLPQYFEYFGFILVIILACFLSLKYFKKREGNIYSV